MTLHSYSHDIGIKADVLIWNQIEVPATQLLQIYLSTLYHTSETRAYP